MMGKPTTRPKLLATSYLFPNRVMKNHGIFVFNRLKAMSRYMDITVINPLPWFPLQSFIKRYHNYDDIPLKEELDGLTVYHPRYFSIPKYFKQIEGNTYYRAIKPIVDELYKKEAFDFVDMHWTFPDLPAGIRLAREYGLSTCVTLRGMEAFHFQDNDRRQHIVKMGLESVDKIIALSDELKEAGEKACSYAGKSIVIRNGVDTETFLYMSQKLCREELGLSAEEKVIIGVGSLIYRKGFDLIIKALAKLKSQGHGDLRLYIVGSEGAEGDYRLGLINLIKEYGLNESVIFVGQVPNEKLKIWYNAADIFCLASRGEGSPNVLTEALACGCPAITTDVGAAKEIILQRDGLGRCIPVDNVDALVAALAETLTDNFAREANAAYLKQFNWDWCARQVNAALQPFWNKVDPDSMEHK